MHLETCSTDCFEVLCHGSIISKAIIGLGEKQGMSVIQVDLMHVDMHAMHSTYIS